MEKKYTNQIKTKYAQNTTYENFWNLINSQEFSYQEIQVDLESMSHNFQLYKDKRHGNK